MLSYQHGFHAGNLADVHKHAALAWILSYLNKKPKPISYIETHAGRGLYDLKGEQAAKTGEAAQGIVRLLDRFSTDHPYARALAQIKSEHGPNAYPGSPLLAATVLRIEHELTLAELHPQEFEVLRDVMRPYPAKAKQQNGFDLALSLAPPNPRRGILICDPSYEVKSDYDDVPKFFAKLHRKWTTGIKVLWYPILTDNRHQQMQQSLLAISPDASISEVTFPPARPGHRMVGSRLFVINPPYGFEDEAKRLEALFDGL